MVFDDEKVEKQHSIEKGVGIILDFMATFSDQVFLGLDDEKIKNGRVLNIHFSDNFSGQQHHKLHHKILENQRV